MTTKNRIKYIVPTKLETGSPNLFSSENKNNLSSYDIGHIQPIKEIDRQSNSKHQHEIVF